MYDVAIIGAGVVGSAIARELSKYQVNACVIEREEDVCNGTSKANSAIIHGGFDATPGTLKAKLNVRGNFLMDELARDLDIPFKRNGSLVVCTKDQDRSGLEKLLEKGTANGVPDLRIIEREELIAMEPNLSDDVTCALFAPTGGIVCPFHMTMAFAENACTNGVKFFLNTQVDTIEKNGDSYRISTLHTDTKNKETFEAKVVINAAGVYADVFNNMVSENKLHITARKGEYCLLDKDAGTHVSHTIFQLPSKMGKGVLVTPTVHGNLLVGPTAVDVDDKEAVIVRPVQIIGGIRARRNDFKQVSTHGVGDGLRYALCSAGGGEIHHQRFARSRYRAGSFRRSSRRRTAHTASGIAGAGSQQQGGSRCAGNLQKLAAGNFILHLIHLHLPFHLVHFPQKTLRTQLQTA